MSDYDSIKELQDQGIIDSKRVATIKICLVAFFHASIFAVLASGVFAIWLNKNVGLDSLQIGELLGLKTVVAIFYKPVFGWLLDKTQLRIHFIITIAIAGLGAGPFFQFVYKPLLMTHNPTLFYTAGLLGGVYFGYVIIAGGAAVWSYCARYVEAHGAPLDKVGAANFLAWLVMGFSLSILYTINPTWGFYLASLAALGMVLSLLSLKVRPFDNLNTKATSKQKVKLVDLKKLIVNPRFYVLAFLAITIMVVIFAQYPQVGRYGLTFWPADKQALGMRVNAFIGLPCNILIFLLLTRASGFIKKLNPTRSIIVLALCYGVALGIFGIAGLFRDASVGGNYIPGVIAMTVAGNALAIVNPFANLVILSYVTTSFDKKIAGTAFLVGFNFIANLGGSAGNAVVGGMFKSQGWQNAYFELSAFIFVCTIILALLMVYSNGHDKKRVTAHLENKA